MSGSTTGLRSWWLRMRWYVPAALAVVLLRTRFLFTPMTSDEGGFLAIARMWRRGAVLHRDVFIDRPDGLLVLFRLLDTIGLGNTFGIRLMALVFCLVGAAACGRIAAHLIGPSAAMPAALATAALTSIPRLEGYIGNGELLSGAPGALALAMALRAVWKRPQPSYGWLAGAGFVGAFAISVKQSGFDAVLVAFVLLMVLVARAGWDRRTGALAVASAAGGFAVPIIAMVVHGAVTGWDRWWFQVVRYRTQVRSLVRDPEWNNLVNSGKVAAPLLGLAVLAVAAGAVRLVRRREHIAAVLVLGGWCLVSGIAFMSGGQYFRHYWIVLMFPLGTVVGALVATLMTERSSRFGLVLLAVILAPPLVAGVYDSTIPRDEVGIRVSSDKRLTASENIADWFEQMAGPGDQIYGLCSGAALAGSVDSDPPLRYLWFLDIESVKGAREEMIAMLSGPGAPRYVALINPVEKCDDTGATAAVLERRYAEVAVFEDFPVLELQPGT